MPRETKKTNVRMSPDEYSRVASAAARLGMSTNRYFVSCALANETDGAMTDRIEAVIDQRLREQTDAIVSGLTQLTEQHDEHDSKLRERLNSALNQVLQAVGGRKKKGEMQ